MSFPTGTPEIDLKVIEKLDTKSVLNLLETHNDQYVTALIIDDAKFRDPDHNNELMKWFVKNVSNSIDYVNLLTSPPYNLNVNFNNGIILYYAVKNGNLDVVKYSLDNRDPESERNNIVTNQRLTDALDLAARNGNLDIVKEIIKSVPDITINDAATFALQNKHQDVIKYLRTVQLKKYYEDDYQHGRLYEAAENNDLELVKSILESTRESIQGGLDPSYAQEIAVKNGNLDIIKYIDDYNYNQENNVSSYSIKALHSGHMDVVDYFQELPQVESQFFDRLFYR